MVILKKNDIITTDIISVSSDGMGVGKIDGFTVFIPFCDEGENVQALIIKVAKTYAVGKLLKVNTPSKNRIDSECAIFEKCGGCCFCHVDYNRELQIKENFVSENVKRIGKVDLPVCEIISSVENREYRNKSQYPVRRDKNGNIQIGFFASHSHRVVDCSSCAIQPLVFSEIIAVLKNFLIEKNYSIYNEEDSSGVLRHIFLRIAEKTGEVMVCFVINAEKLPMQKDLISLLCGKFECIKTICVNINRRNDNVIMGEKTYTIFGDGFITDILCDTKFRISPNSFYQVNRATAEVLYNKAFELANFSENDVLLDLYCGIGTIGLSAAKRVKKLIGVEIVPEAIEDAKINAELNGITNAEFFCADAKKAAKEFSKNGLSPTVIIVDPPRKGCDREVIEAINEMAPSRVVMISCDSATMSRDLGVFKEYGYTAVSITPVDMFPRTKHCETVALLSRQINVHKMKLNSAPFEMIKNGEKTIELRLFDEKRQKIKVGDKIVFTENTTGETLNTTVVKLYRFDSFKELYKSLPLLKCGYTTENVDNATPSDMEQYYSVEEQRKYGVVGIELCRPEQITDECVCLLCKE